MSVTGYFEKLLAEHGDSPRALDWSAEGQAKRFTVLQQVGIEAQRTVTDVGCGLGHFARWLMEHGVYPNAYTGLDASEQMIHAARRLPLFPGVSFGVADALTHPIPEADFVVCSGLLNILEMKDAHYPIVTATRLITKMFQACKVGVAVNMLSTWAPKQRIDRMYYDPRAMLLIVQDLTRKVALRHDYMPNDFTLFLYK